MAREHPPRTPAHPVLCEGTLLPTKLYFPPTRPRIVPRPRLLERLQAGLQGPLTLISAPAGFVKTTLLGEWHASVGRDLPAAWRSLDPDDNDAIRFLPALPRRGPGVDPQGGTR
jgi:LuxR family maltose regulon positive regulatory protein